MKGGHLPMPEDYEIRVKGHLDDLWLPYFTGLRLEHLESGETLLSGALLDQAALHGILERIRDLNLTLISVTHCSQSNTHLTRHEE
jgi:hypothetical protein